ncbi:pentatricopeptide repeat-containing protein At4g13650-like [Selaginella moellendorffii]|nr:pentatricopeptide repeat-containing protein At4g13650-like [Selaginella moellendorffii]|eukprot:XP_024524296.1 pentatricopeptide repeat-containing protein At4g13650-like [Selaginella moellendorffii]
MGTDLTPQIKLLQESIDSLHGNDDDSRIVSLLRQCGESRALAQGKRLHDYLRQVGKDTETFVGNWIIQMYGRCGYAQAGLSEDVGVSYRSVLLEGLRPDRISFVGALQSCSCPIEGKRIHSHTIQSGLESDIVITTAIVVMYGMCHNVDAARRCFEMIANPDTVLCNALITAYARNEHLEDAERLFDSLRTKDVASYTAMVTGYAENGHLEKARDVFEKTPQKNVVSWNAILGVYSEAGRCLEALALFERMKSDGISPNRITCIRVLDICARLGAIEQGREIESFAVKAGFAFDTVLSNAVVNMYGKCKDLDSAVKAYKRMSVLNLVSWNSLLAAYAQNGHCKEAVHHFKLMDLEGIQANDITFSTFFDACGGSNAIKDGRIVHEELLETHYLHELPVANSLVSMYGSCGSVEDAEETFWDMRSRNVISWTGMITAYAQNGYNSKALEMLHAMNLEGVSPNDITFVSVLSACSHGGLSKRGLGYLASMLADYGLAPTIDHYVCAIDVVGRSGEAGEASTIAKAMPFEPDPVAWTSILAACSVQQDASLGAVAAEKFRDLDPKNDASYVMESKLWS